MTMQNYSTVASRNLIRAEKGMLKNADKIIVLGKTGQQYEQPKNMTDTLVFRRLQPFGAVQAANPAAGFSGTPDIAASNFILSEGITPTANTISYVDISATLQNYGVLFKYTSKTQLMYEDDVPADMQKLVGSTLAEVLEMVRYGQYKAGTSVIYANGSSRSAVNTVISLDKLRVATRAMESNRARQITEVLAPGTKYDTSPIESGFIVYMSTDGSANVRNLPNFKPAVNYSSGAVMERELGACEEFRFIVSPLLKPFADAGAAIAGTTVKSTTGTLADVYPMIVCAEDAWGSVALKGMGAIKPVIISANERNHANPSGLFGYVGADTWFTAVRTNENWMTRIEVAVSAL